MNSLNFAETFYGRQQELRRIYSVLRAKECTSLCGRPRIGKTFLLKCLSSSELQQRCGYNLDRYIFVYIDLAGHLQKTSEEFFDTLCHHIVNKSRNQKLLRLVNISGRGGEGFSNILEQINEQGFHIVLELDSFDALIRNTHFDLIFLEFLRSQASMKYISYITASIAPLYKISQHFTVGSPFFNVFYNYELGPLEYNDARTLTQIFLNQEDIQKADQAIKYEKDSLFSDNEVEWVLDLAGLNPFFIQHVCHYLNEEKRLDGTSPVSLNAIRDRAYSSLLPNFAYIWKNVSEEEQDLLKYEAQHEEVQQRNLAELAGSALFRQFVQQECHIQPFDMFSEIKQILEKIKDIKLLGESKLAYMNVVSKNFKQDTRPSVAEKGTAVRKALYEAFDGLRSLGTRSDSDPNWLIYNILHYRYFKNNMKNEQIAARLGITIRTYYRFKDKAIKALSEALEEMEATAKSKTPG